MLSKVVSHEALYGDREAHRLCDGFLCSKKLDNRNDEEK